MLSWAFWRNLTCVLMKLYLISDQAIEKRWFLISTHIDDFPWFTSTGMAFRPLPDIKTPLIRFEQGVRSTYKIYTDNIQAFIDRKYYEDIVTWSVSHVEYYWNIFIFFYSEVSTITKSRDHSVYAPSQWVTTLQCNVVSHWLVGAYTKWSLTLITL